MLHHVGGIRSSSLLFLAFFCKKLISLLPRSNGRVLRLIGPNPQGNVRHYCKSFFVLWLEHVVSKTFFPTKSQGLFVLLITLCGDANCCLTPLKDWEVVAMSGYDDVRDVGQAVTLQEKKDDDDDDDAIMMDLMDLQKGL